MSLAIDMDSVKEVLLPDGKWHRIADNSFEIDTYQYLRAKEAQPGGDDAEVRLGGGQEEVLSTCGARWTETNSNGKKRRVFCPITAIQAVSYG